MSPSSAGENLAVCHHIALNLLREEESFKAGSKPRREDSLLKILESMYIEQPRQL